MNGKRIFTLLFVLVMVIGLTACGAKKAPVAEAAPSEVRDTVMIAIGDEPTTLDPTKGWGHGNAPIMQSTLVRYDADMTFVNDLATDYSLSEDGLVWTFKIRKDAYFTDGQQVTAKDVAFTLETAKAAKGSIDLTFMDSAVAADDFTVVITLNTPTFWFLNTLASVGIVPEHAYSDAYGTNPAVTSGPYKFVEWRSQEQLVLEANENYYGEVPAIKNVIIVFMGEDAALAAVQAGQVDAAITSATLAVNQINGYHIERIATADCRGFTLPVLPAEGEVAQNGAPIGNNVTCNIEIRQAIAYAIDRQVIADVALNGYATPAFSENDGMPWNNPAVKIETNVDYAKQLLRDAGWADTDGDGIVEKDGLKAEFTCMYPAGDSARQAILLACVELLKEVGINVIPEGLSWDKISLRMFSEAVMMGWGAANPSETYFLYQSKGALLDDYYNPEGHRSEVTDGYLEAARQALTPEEAYENFQKVQWDGETGTAMIGQCPWVWIVNLDHVYFIRDGLNIGNQYVHPHGSNFPFLQNIQDWTWTA